MINYNMSLLDIKLPLGLLNNKEWIASNQELLYFELNSKNPIRPDKQTKSWCYNLKSYSLDYQRINFIETDLNP